MSSPGRRIITESLELGAGHVLAGRFVIEDELGSGGMGTVFRAIDQQTGARIAIKGLNQPAPDLLMRFKREYRALADVRHPNLVRLGELFEAGGHVYFSMELIEGTDFLSWVRPRRAGGQSRRARDRGAIDFDEVRLRESLRQVADGLTALHAANQVHRDIKPANLLVEPSGRVVLLDFGLATRVEDGRQQSDIIAAGTVAYMAPEQASGQPVGPRADWYSVGVLLFEALTGDLPFDGDLVALVTAKISEDAPDPEARVAGLPADLAELCRELLSRAPQRRPSGAQVVRRLGPSTRSHTEPRTPATASAGFVGRRAELDELTTALAAAQRGPVFQLVVGESGLGKTSLVQAFLSLLTARDDLLVLAGRCHERESLPFKAFDGVADVLSRRLSRWADAEVEAVLPRRIEMLGALFPALDQVPLIGRAATITGAVTQELDLRESRRRAFGAFRELLARIAERQPLIVFVDDLHRADPDSIDLLRHLMRPDGGQAPLLIGTARPSPVLDSLIAMGARGEIVVPRVLRLESLEDGPARELARLALARGGGPAPSGSASPIAAIVAEGRGHPGFILELTRAATVADRDGGSLDAVFMARVDRLPTEQRAVLDVLAVAEAPIQLAVLATAMHLDSGHLVPLLDALHDADLIATSGRRGSDWVETYHDRVGDAVRDRLTVDAGRAAHAALARALDTSAAADPERILSHYLAAGESGPVLRLATVAADRAAATMEHRRAARLCRLALAHAPPAVEAERLHLAAATALATLGIGVEAADHYLHAAELALARGDGDVGRRCRRHAADQLLLSGEVSRGVAVLDEVLRDFGLGIAGSTTTALARLAWSRARLRLRGRSIARRSRPLSARDRELLDACWSAALGLAMVDPIRGADYQARFLRLALRSGDRALAARGLAIEAAYVSTGGAAASAAAHALLDEADQLASTEVDRGWVDLGRAVTSLMVGDLAGSAAAADRAVDAFVGRAGGDTWAQRNARIYVIRSRWWQGRLAEFAPLVRAAVADTRQHGDHYSLVQLLVGVGGLAWLMADDLAGLWANVEEATALWSAPSYQLPDYYRMNAVVRGHVYGDDGAAAWRQVASDWPKLARASLMRIDFMAIDAWFLRGGAAAAAALVADGPERATLHGEIKRCVRRLASRPEPMAQGNAASLRAAVASQRGDRAAAGALLSEAADHFERAEVAGFAAAARWRAAELRGQPVDLEIVTEIAAALRAMGVVAPPRFVAMLVPGVVTTATTSP